MPLHIHSVLRVPFAPVRIQPAGLYLSLTHGPVAQWLEQGTHNPLVVGSSPTGPISP